MSSAKVHRAANNTLAAPGRDTKVPRAKASQTAQAPAADTPAQPDEAAADIAIYSGADGAGTSSLEAKNDAESSGGGDEPDWGGDGSTEMVPDDGEWGGEAPARNSGVSDGDETASAADLARRFGTVTSAH